MRALLILPLLVASDLAAQEEAWLGAWKLAASPEIAPAILRCTESMSFLTRPIARGRLTKLNPAYQRLSLRRLGEDFELQFDGRPPLRLPADGRAVPWTREDGESFLVSARPEAGRLLQHYQGADGERSNVFRMDPSGKTLSLEVTVKSRKLPAPLVYTLRYAR